MKAKNLTYALLALGTLFAISGCDSSTNSNKDLSGIEVSLKNLEGKIGSLQESQTSQFAEISKDKENDWLSAFETGNELAASGDNENMRKATHYYLNALNKNPGKWEIIEAYKSVINQLINAAEEAGELEEEYSICNAGENFLKSQIAYTAADKIETLQNWSAELEAQKESLIERTNQSISQTDSENPEEASPQDTGLEDFADEHAELKVEYEKSLKAIQKSIELGRFEFAAYQIQDAEQKLHLAVSLATISEDSGENAQQWAEIEQMKQNLETISIAANDAKSEKIWNDTQKNLVLPQPVPDTPENVVPSETHGNGECTQQIAAAQKVIIEIQKIYPNLSEKYQKEADSKTTAAADLLECYSQERQRRYSIWAINQIEKGARKALEGVNKFTRNNYPKISQSLNETIGKIDTRFLSFETSRAYQEVINYFITKVNSFKKDDDSDEDTINTLTMLEKLDLQDKAQLTDF